MVNQCLEFGEKLVSADVQCVRAQELCESGGGRPGLPVPTGPNGFCGRKVMLKRNHVQGPTPTTEAVTSVADLVLW